MLLPYTCKSSCRATTVDHPCLKVESDTSIIVVNYLPTAYYMNSYDNPHISKALHDLASDDADSVVEWVSRRAGVPPCRAEERQAWLTELRDSLYPSLLCGFHQSLVRSDFSGVRRAWIGERRSTIGRLPDGTGVQVNAEADIESAVAEFARWSNGSIITDVSGRPRTALVKVGPVRASTSVARRYSTPGRT